MCPNISIIVLNYNRLDDIAYTLNHIRQLIVCRNDIEVIVVDNASTDGSRVFLQQNRHWLKVVQLEENGGIAGLNEGFEHAIGEYIVVLDDDSHLKGVITFTTLMQCFRANSEVGVIA